MEPERRAVRLDGERALDRLRPDQERPVARDLDELGRESIHRRRLGEDEKVLDRAVPEELLGGEAAVAERRLEEGDVVDAGGVDPGRVPREDDPAHLRRVAVVVGDDDDRRREAGDGRQGENDVRAGVQADHDDEGDERRERGAGGEEERREPDIADRALDDTRDE